MPSRHCCYHGACVRGYDLDLSAYVMISSIFEAHTRQMEHKVTAEVARQPFDPTQPLVEVGQTADFEGIGGM